MSERKTPVYQVISLIGAGVFLGAPANFWREYFPLLAIIAGALGAGLIAAYAHAWITAKNRTAYRITCPRCGAHIDAAAATTEESQRAVRAAYRDHIYIEHRREIRKDQP